MLAITSQDRATNVEVLSQASLSSVFTLHERRTNPKGHSLQQLSRSCGRPRLCHKYVCKRDMKAVGIDTASWDLTFDCMSWRSKLKRHLHARGREICQCSCWKEGMQESSSHHQQTKVYIQMWPLQQILSLTHLSTQSHAPLVNPIIGCISWLKSYSNWY